MSILKDYQKFTPTTFVVPSTQVPSGIAYLYSGIAAEGGEVAGVFAKWCRGDFDVDELKARTFKELGDVLYFASQIANSFDLSLEDIIKANQSKLEDRFARGKIKGDGEVR
jgi:NTP pyrophosphatase (non-canonical NTP hydrolase)